MQKFIKKMKKGFTIMELVIVIAVIAILAAVLIPTFSNITENANESAAMQEASHEWTNFSVEVATDPVEDKDYLIIREDDGDYTYWLVENGQFQTTEATGFSLTYDSSTYTFTISNNSYTSVKAVPVGDSVKIDSTITDVDNATYEKMGSTILGIYHLRAVTSE